MEDAVTVLLPINYRDNIFDAYVPKSYNSFCGAAEIFLISLNRINGYVA